MTWSQGWIVPQNSKILHYVLDGRSLCGRWLAQYPFYRMASAEQEVPNAAFRYCVDCKRYVAQRLANNTLPPEPPEPNRRAPFFQ